MGRETFPAELQPGQSFLWVPQSYADFAVDTLEVSILSANLEAKRLGQIATLPDGEGLEGIVAPSGNVSSLDKHFVLARVGRYKTDEGDITGTFADVRPDRHSVHFRNGIRMTIGREFDIHSRGSKTIEDRYGVHRAEVLSSDHGLDLTQFAVDAIAAYRTDGLHNTAVTRDGFLALYFPQ